MVKPVDPKRTIEWVHASDLNEDGTRKADATVFRIGALTKRQRAQLVDAGTLARQVQTADGGVSITSRMGYVEHQRVRFGLRGVENYSVPWETTDGDGAAAGVKVPSDAFLDTIPDEVFSELSHKIAEISTLTEDDAGKS